jgi:endonuclease III
MTALHDTLSRYSGIRSWVLLNCGSKEFEQYDRGRTSAFEETDLLREHAWVVLNGGFSEKVMRRIFPVLGLCFHDWSSAEAITRNAELCRATALAVFKNRKKIDSIIALSELVCWSGFATVRARIETDPVHGLQLLPGVGPVTAWHLAKNLGWDVAKPDRHLERITKLWGYTSASQLCLDIATHTTDSVAQVDYILWRYASLTPGYELIKAA